MVNLAPVQTVAVKSGPSFFKIVGWVFLSLFTIILVFDAIYIALDKKSFEPVITKIGGQLTLASQQLSITSKTIVENEGLYHRTDDFWSGIGTMIYLSAFLFVSIYTIYQWINVFKWLISRSPLSTPDKVFNNYLLAIIFFLVLQSIFSLAVAGVNKEIDGFSGTEHSAMSYISLPITSFYDFWKALKFIVYPLDKLGF